MRGHIRQRSPGHWAIVLDNRDPATGKRKRKWHSFDGTKREAQTECSRLITEMKGGSYLEPNKTTLAEFLTRWLEHMKSQVAPRTHERYEELCTKNIAPQLGAVILTKLKPAQISHGYAKALANGRRNGTGGLSPRTVHHMHRVLKQALGQAVKWQMLARNPADAVDPPKVERKAPVVYNTDEAAEALATRMYVPTLLGITCGLRRGEICALRWRSIDLDRGQLAVIASTEQTKAGCREKEAKNSQCRTVALAASVVRELRQHKTRQAEELLRLGDPPDPRSACGGQGGWQPIAATVSDA